MTAAPNNGSSFEFYEDYVNKEKALQPEYYSEIENILNKKITDFTEKNGYKPTVLDIGSAGIIPYDPEKVEKAVIVDLFDKPGNIVLPVNMSWTVGNFLEPKTVEKLMSGCRFNIIIVSSVLHHLCNSRNNELKHLEIFIRHLSAFNGAGIYIFESVCPQILATLQDIVWPLQSFVLNKLIGFTDVRMLSKKELYKILEQEKFNVTELNFKQPEYIAQLFIKVPLALYPLELIALEIEKRSCL